MFPVIHVAVRALSSTPDQTFAVKRGALARQYAQQGDIDWITVTFPKKTPVKSIGMEAKRPRVLFHHAKDMQKVHEYDPLDPQYDPQAVCMKVTLQVRSRLITEHLYSSSVASTINKRSNIRI